MKAGNGKWLMVACGVGFAGACLAQGSLTPPGAPAPTMKTLHQVEPRTTISSVPAIINQGGSYYLTTNLTVAGGADGITVNADDVTIDLNGFTLRGPGGGSGHGIVQQSFGRYLRVHNGRIVNWQGTGSYGIMAATGFGNRFEDLVVAECDSGISGGDDCEVTRCHVHDNLAQGEGYGIRAGGRARVTSCFLAGNNSNGSPKGSAIQVGFGSMVSDCYLMENLYTGIQVSDTCQVVRNHCSQNGLVWSKPAIHATGNENRIENNSLMNNAIGIKVDGTGTLVAENRVTGPFHDSYDFAPGNQLELIISQLPESIDWPCSVKLVGTLTCSLTGTNGITVNSDHVTIDMAGHTLIGPGSASGSGIHQAYTLRNLTVKNGKVSGWRGSSAGGIYAAGTGNYIHGIQAATNDYGIYSGKSSMIEDCAAVDNSTGIAVSDGSTINDCSASGNVGAGIQAQDGSTVNNCASQGNGSGYNILGAGVSVIGCTAYANAGSGIFAYDACSVIDCTVAENGGVGIGCYWSDNTVKGCTARRNTGDGIRVGDNCFVVDNNCAHNGVAGVASGIHATGSDNRIEGNTVTGNDRGIEVVDVGNFIVRNIASGNGTANYDIWINNKVGVIVIAPNSAAINGSTGGAGVGSTDPWANFSF